MLSEIIQKVLHNQSVKDKLSIYSTHHEIGKTVSFRNPLADDSVSKIQVGDDCAAIPDGNGGYLLFASEGIIPSFLESYPWFAGYSAVMVNISDVCAMGGLPLALTDVLWIHDEEDGKEVWAGMKAASEVYGVPIVGGHTCYRSEKKHLAVSVLGRAQQLLTSYDARAGDVILMAIDLNGSYFGNYPFWNASTSAGKEHIKKILSLMYQVASRELASVAKDISMGGVIGTLAMLLNTSEAGAKIWLEKLPRPVDISWEKWLISFPSFGYIITAAPEKAAAIKELFHAAEIACEVIGEITTPREIEIHYKEEIITIELK